MMVSSVKHSAAKLLQVLRNKGFSPVYKSYLMEHEVCMEEVADISQWLQAAFSVGANLFAQSAKQWHSPDKAYSQP